MTRHASGGADVGFGEGGDEEIIRLARDSSELHYRHEIDIDIDAMREDLRRRVPIEAQPPQSRHRQAWVSISHAGRQVPWDSRTIHRHPFVVLFAALAVATVVATFVLLVRDPGPLMPGTAGAGRGAGDGGSSISSSTVPGRHHPLAGQATSPYAGQKTSTAGHTEGAQPPPPRPADRPASGTPPLAVDISLGGKSGSLIGLDVTVKGPGSGRIAMRASLRVSVDPATAACSLTGLGHGDLGVSQLLAGLKAPVRMEVQLGSGRPLVIQLSPTGVPSQPLSCSIPGPDSQLSRPDGAVSSGSLAGTAGKILGGAVSSIPLLSQH